MATMLTRCILTTEKHAISHTCYFITYTCQAPHSTLYNATSQLTSPTNMYTKL